MKLLRMRLLCARGEHPPFADCCLHCVLFLLRDPSGVSVLQPQNRKDNFLRQCLPDGPWSTFYLHPRTSLHLDPVLLFHCLQTSPHLCAPWNRFSGGRQLPGLFLPGKLLVFMSCFESSFVKPPWVLLQTPCLLFSCNLYHILFYGDFCCPLFCVSN